MSRDMETVYQSKVTEKLQKLDESKQNVKDFLFWNLLEGFISNFRS
jgi:hypothetical protein